MSGKGVESMLHMTLPWLEVLPDYFMLQMATAWSSMQYVEENMVELHFSNNS